MATLSKSESRRLYSWWWDSHISPTNSKWLQENLTDMDTKVKAMIKLLEEDADSFARRAEMYYKKRPELLKLVEEFYRAYRALAERYDHAMVELRHAHKTMAEAFPNQAHYMLTDDSQHGSLTPGVPRPMFAPLEPGSAFELSSIDNMSKKNESSSRESDDGGKAESEVQTLRKALAKIQSEKDAIFLQYQKNLEKLTEMERDLINAQKDAGGLHERASKAEIEINILKEALAELKTEKDSGLVQYNQCLQSIARLEAMLSMAQLDAKGLSDRATKAESEAKNLKQEIARLEAEKDAGLLQYKQCLEKISVLEAKTTLSEKCSRILNEQIEKADLEVTALRKNLVELNEEKEVLAVHYHQCLEKISKMESEILHAQQNCERLNREIEKGAEKLKSAEKHYHVLEKSNQSLQLDAENLMQKIAIKDQELFEKNNELERLQTRMHEEHSQFFKIESTLQNLQKLYSQSQQEQRTLALELKYGLQMLKDIELSKQGFKEEMQEIVEENRTLHELHLSSTRSLEKQQMEISKLKAVKDLLEREFALNTEESNALQRESHQIKDDIRDLNNRYQAMLEQLQTLGLNTKCFAASVKDLQNENLMLKEVCKIEQDEKEALREKSKDIDELLIENAYMELSLYKLNDELDGLKATVKKFQESCKILHEEKSNVVAEKSTLLSQLQIITGSLQELLEKNALLEKSLSDAKLELGGSKAKSSSLEESCRLLNDEKYTLLNERNTLVSQLESVEMRLGNLEKRFIELEEKYSGVKKDKENRDIQVEELRASILVQQEKHATHKHSSEARLENLENLVHALLEEQRLAKIEFEEELDKAVNAQLEMFILQSCIEDLEQKNLALLLECEKHAESSRFSEKVVSELEIENLMQLMEVEFLLHEVRKFKIGIHQVCGALQIDPDGGHDKGIKQEEIPIPPILDNIEGLKSSLVKSQEEKQQLLIENLVLLTSLRQHKSEGEKVESAKRILEQESENMREQSIMLRKDKAELLQMNSQLRSEVDSGEVKENTLKSELAAVHVELMDLRRKNEVFQEENSKLLEEKNSLLKRVLDLKDEMSAAEDQNDVILHELLTLCNLSLVYENFVTEKSIEQKSLSEHLSNISRMNSDLEQDLGVLKKEFEEKEAENVYLNESVERMNKQLREARNANDLLRYQIENTENVFKKKEAEQFQMEKRLKAVETLNAEFCRYIEDLKIEQQESRLVKEKLDRQILRLSEDCMNHEKEIEHLNEANISFQSETRFLLQEVEQYRVREETLNSQLLDKTNEFKLWEAEAAAFYFDLQISTIRETLLGSKIDELTGVCKRLDDESAAKSLVIQQMRERMNLLESEIGGLKGQLSANVPIVTSLKEDFSSLEHTCLIWTNKTSVVGSREQKGVVIETCIPKNSCQCSRENGSTLIPDLLSMQTRIRAVEKEMMEEIERRVKEENLTANVEEGPLMEMKKDSNLEVANVENRKVATENRLLMKDIPLDHNRNYPESVKCYKREDSQSEDEMVELCEQSCAAKEDDVTWHGSDNNLEKCNNSSSELEVEKELGVDKHELSKTAREATQNGKRKMLERLASDAQKLAILKTTVQDLKRKPVTEKKNKKGNDTEYETVKRQIQEVEEAVMQLEDINGKLTKDIEESTSSSMELEKIQRRRVTEQARRGSEQIGRLQFEVQNIQYVLLKLADDRNNKGKHTLSRPTGVLLRDFIHTGNKNSKRRRCLCCSRPSTNED